jgi:hypothetical protein
MKRPLFSLFSLSLVFLSAASVRAAGSTDKVSAEALFDEGRKLMAAGKFADACPKFEASQELDPGVGTMLNLADCYEKTGRTASAWAEFRETVSAAHNAGSRDREEIARGRANDLEQKLYSVQTHGSYASVDAAAGPSGFFEPFQFESPEGPLRGEGTFTESSGVSYTSPP